MKADNLEFGFSNKYLEKYFEIISKPLLSEYSERHHIFPTSIFGKNKSIVRLSFIDHFYAHYYLALAYKEENYVHEFNKMSNALIRFCSKNKYRMDDLAGLNDEELELFVKDLEKGRAEYSSSIKGSKYYHNPATGKNIRVLHGQPIPDGFVLGLIHSEEGIQGIKEGAKKKIGKPCPWNIITNKNTEKIKKTAEKHLGMKRSEEAKNNMRKPKSSTKRWACPCHGILFQGSNLMQHMHKNGFTKTEIEEYKNDTVPSVQYSS